MMALVSLVEYVVAHEKRVESLGLRAVWASGFNPGPNIAAAPPYKPANPDGLRQPAGIVLVRPAALRTTPADVALLAGSPFCQDGVRSPEHGRGRPDSLEHLRREATDQPELPWEP